MKNPTLAGLAALLLGVATSLVGVSTALAQGAPQLTEPVIISSNAGLPLLLDGLESEKLPAGVRLGTTVCTPGKLLYKTEGERFIFKQWSDGTTDECITPSHPGAYRANFTHEVLLVVRSSAPGIQQSMWVTFGSPIHLEVPAVVQDGENTRFRFQGWSDGEAPFERSNTIAPVKPTVLEVKWTREHRLLVEGPDSADLKGTGWYSDGTNLVLRAPDTLAGDTDQDRWKFSHWESTSFPPAVIQNAQAPIAALSISMPYSIRAAYDKQYLVYATSAVGTLKRDWVNAGEEVVLEAAPVLEVVPEQERLVFKRWDGMEGLLSPKISGKVDKPLIVTAAYERQVMLKVNAPHGASGDGWHKVGNVGTVAVPPSVSQMLILKSSMLGFTGYPAGAASIQVLVNEPTNLTALYRTEPDLLIIALLLALPLAGVLLYVSMRRGWLTALSSVIRVRMRAVAELRRRRRPGVTEYSIHRNGAHLTQPVQYQQR